MRRQPPPEQLLAMTEYAEFAAWENTRQFDQDALAWWLAKLRGVPELISLPLDMPRPAAQTTEGTHVLVHMEDSLTAHVASLCQASGATVNTSLLCVWAALLRRLSADEDVVVGIPHSMRHTAALQACVGMFINTLPLRLSATDRSVRDEVRALQQYVGQALPRAHVPLYQIVQARGAERSAAHSPLFQVMFHSTSAEEAVLVDGPEGGVSEPTVKFDVEMELLHLRGQIHGRLIYDSAIYEQGTAVRWVALLKTLLLLSATQPEAPLREISPADSAEQGKTLLSFNATAPSFPTGMCLHDLVKQQAQDTPNAIALEWEGAQMTFRGLTEGSRRVAHWLCAKHVAPDRVVALQLHRSLEQVVGILGVLTSGGAYLPLDPSLPVERRRFMVEDADCQHLLAQSLYLADFGNWFSGSVMPLDSVQHLPLEDHHVAERARLVSPDHLAYVMYTSGSTGRPKGVMVPHKGVVNLLHGARLRYPRDPKCVFGVPTPYVFDVSVYNLFTSLVVHGGTCHLLQDGSSLLLLTDTQQLTRVAAVPSVLAMTRLPATVTDVEVGGEALFQAAVDSAPPSVRMYNYYGPTEAAIWATRRVVSYDELPRRLPSIGHPLPNVTCYVVDPNRAADSPRLQPIGVHGELWLGGVQVARGYLNRPEITASAFVCNPWVHADPSGHGVVYRTGDRVRWHDDGELEFSGRLDFQVKLCDCYMIAI